jgi:acyl carrier protein
MKSPGKIAKLKDLAYTLQTGRDPMLCRLAFIARDPEEILKKLEIFLNHREALGKNDLYIGYRTAEKRPRMEETLDDLGTVQSSPVMMEKIAELWASGREIDWESIYQNERCLRVALPTYPFSKERYWIGGQLEDAPFEPSTDAPGPLRSPIPTIVRNEEDEKPGQPEISPFLAELCQALEGERQGMIEKYVQDLLASLLAFNPPDVPELHQGFFDMGMESVIAEQFRASLEESFLVDIADTAVFDYPNISELSEYIIKHIPFSEIEKLDQPSLAAVGVGPVPTHDLASAKQFLNELDILTTDDAQKVQAISLEEVVDELSTLLNELEYNTHSS